MGAKATALRNLTKDCIGQDNVDVLLQFVMTGVQSPFAEEAFANKQIIPGFFVRVSGKPIWQGAPDGHKNILQPFFFCEH